MLGSPTEEWGENGLMATVKLICAWTDRTALVADIVGLRRVYPRIPASFAFARSSSCVPFCDLPAGLPPNNVQYIESGAAVVTIKYDVKGPQQKNGNQLYSESLEGTAEFMTLDPSGFSWGSSGGTPLKDGEAPGRLARGLDYILTLYSCPRIPSATFDLMECVNSGPVMAPMLGMTFAKETLLYNPPSLSRKVTADGTEGWDITYRFTYRAAGWNVFWRASTGAYEAMYVTGGTKYKNYPTANFNGVWG